MNNALEKFQFNNHPVRVEIIDDEAWFVAKDICDVLGLSNGRVNVSRLDEDERDTVTIHDAIGRKKQMAVVSESGMYNLVFKSHKPEAKQFRRWVTHEVLPAIRREGIFVAEPSPALPDNGNSLAIAKQLVNVADEHDQRLSDLEQKMEEGVPVHFPEEPDSGVLFPRVHPSFMTISAFARKIGAELTHSEILSAGGTIAHYCRQVGVWYEKHGNGNRYPTNLLAEYFKE